MNTFESICRIVRSGGRLLGAAQGSAGTGPAAIPDGNLIRDTDIFVPRRDCIDRSMLTKVADTYSFPLLCIRLLQSAFFHSSSCSCSSSSPLPFPSSSTETKLLSISNAIVRFSLRSLSPSRRPFAFVVSTAMARGTSPRATNTGAMG